MVNTTFSRNAGMARQGVGAIYCESYDALCDVRDVTMEDNRGGAVGALAVNEASALVMSGYIRIIDNSVIVSTKL